MATKGNRQIAIEVFSPTEGIHTELSPSMITPRSTPNVSDGNAYYGVVQKEYGTSLFATSSDVRVSDVYDSKVVLMVHCNGVDETVTFVDASTYAHSIDADGDAQKDTAQYKFGSSSLLLDGTLDHLNVASHAKFSFAATNFTARFWIRYSSTVGIQSFMGQYVDAENYWHVFKDAAQKLSMIFETGNVVKGSYIMTGASGLNVNTWHHFEFSRNDSGALIFIDGTSQGLTETVAFDSNNVGNIESPLFIGDLDGDGSTDEVFGHMDEIQILNGTIAHTGNFTVATAEYAPDAAANVPVSFIYEAPFSMNAALMAFTHTQMDKFSGGTFANDGQVYTGTFTDIWNVEMHNDVMFYTNGEDLLQYKLSHIATGTNEPGALAAGSYKALALVSFKDHLNLYHTTEAGTESRKRVRWSKVGAMTYTASDWSTAGSGFLDIQDGNGQLLTAAKLGAGVVAVYFENSIHEQRWVGGSEVYRFDKTIFNVNIPSKRGIVADEATHYVLTGDGIYEYRGGSDWTKISTPIDNVFTSQVNEDALNTAYLQYIKEDAELRVYVPEGVATYPDKCWICKVKAGYAWYKANRPYTAEGRSTRAAALTIGELVGNIGAQDWKFGDKYVTAGSPVYLLGDKSGRVVKMDKTLYSMSESGTSVPQSFVFDSKDFTSIGDVDPLTRNRYNLSQYMDNNTRWQRASMELKGAGTAHLQYSVDGGGSWTAFPEGGKTLTNAWILHEWDIDVATQQMRLRLANTATNESIHMRYMKVEFVPGSKA